MAALALDLAQAGLRPHVHAGGRSTRKEFKGVAETDEVSAINLSRKKGQALHDPWPYEEFVDFIGLRHDPAGGGRFPGRPRQRKPRWRILIHRQEKPRGPLVRRGRGKLNQFLYVEAT